MSALFSRLCDVLRDCVFWGQPRSGSRALAYLALTLAVAAGLAPRSFRIDEPLHVDSHAVLSLDLAMSWALCGQPYHASVRNVAFQFVADDSLRWLPMPQAVERLSGSVARYCAELTPASNNENALMLLEAAILRIHPDISLAQMGSVLHAIRIVALLGFVLLILELGGSLLLALGTVLAGLGLLVWLRAALFAQYPFLFEIALVGATLYGFAWHRRWAESATGAVLVAVVAGLLSAFMLNLRTSYTPIVLAQFAGFVTLACCSRFAGHGISRRRRAVLLVAGFAVAVGAFHYTLIARHFPEAAAHGQHHSISHPLVLALAAPPNALSQELGISWLDAVGAEKALSVDPEAEYLGPRYDAALLRYYTSLWRSRPLEMLDVYRLKFASVGPDMITALRTTTLFSGLPASALLAPLSWLPSGLWLLAVYLAIAGAMLIHLVRSGSATAFVALLLSTAAVLAQAEAGVIYSLWVPNYHGYLAFAAIFLSLVGAQIGMNRLPVVWSRMRSWWLVEAARREVQLFLGLSPPRPFALSRLLGQLVVLAVLAVLTMPAGVRGIERTLTADRQAAAAVDVALRWALCGLGPARHPEIPVASAAVLGRDRQLAPLRALAIDQAGSVGAYCAAAGDRLSHGGALVAVQALLLHVRPGLTPAGLGKSLHYLRLGAILTAGAILVALGFSPAFVYAATYANLWVLAELGGHLFASEAFAPVLLLLSVVLCGWAAVGGCWRTNGLAAGFGAIAGGWFTGLLLTVPGVAWPLSALLAVTAFRLASACVPAARASRAWSMAAAAAGTGVIVATAAWLAGLPGEIPEPLATRLPSALERMIFAGAAGAAVVVGWRWQRRSAAALPFVAACLAVAVAAIPIGPLTTGGVPLVDGMIGTMMLSLFALLALQEAAGKLVKE